MGYKLTWAYIGSQKVRPHEDPIIPRTPWDDTKLYFEFENDINNSAWTSYGVSGSSWLTYTEVGGQYAISNTSYNSYIKVSWNCWASIGTWNFALSLWVNPVAPSSWKDVYLFHVSNTGIYYQGTSILWKVASSEYATSSWLTNFNGSWHHLVMTRNGTTVTCYIDNVATSTFTSSASFSTSTEGNIFASSGWRWSTSWAQMDKFILEAKWWSAADVDNYFRSTKAIYWVS